jgi:hypothetical protein
LPGRKEGGTERADLVTRSVADHALLEFAGRIGVVGEELAPAVCETDEQLAGFEISSRNDQVAFSV